MPAFLFRDENFKRPGRLHLFFVHLRDPCWLIKIEELFEFEDHLKYIRLTFSTV